MLEEWELAFCFSSCLNWIFLYLLPDLGCRQCADGWLTFGRSCFFLSTYRLGWEQSQRNCTARGGSLAIITSREVQVDLSSLELTSSPDVDEGIICTVHLCKCVNGVFSCRIFCPRKGTWSTGSGWDKKETCGPGSTTLQYVRGDWNWPQSECVQFFLSLLYQKWITTISSLSNNQYSFPFFAVIGQAMRHQVIVGSWTVKTNLTRTGSRHPAMPTPTSSVSFSSDSVIFSTEERANQFNKHQLFHNFPKHFSFHLTLQSVVTSKE